MKVFSARILEIERLKKIECCSMFTKSRQEERTQVFLCSTNPESLASTEYHEVE
jgi:hypothetical protein